MGLSSRTRSIVVVSLGVLMAAVLASNGSRGQADASLAADSSTGTLASTLSSSSLSLADTVQFNFSYVSGGQGSGYTFRNNGDSPLTLSATPLFCGPFRLDGPSEPEELLPGGSRRYNVWFFPQTYHSQTCGFSLAEGTGNLGVKATWTGGTFRVFPRTYSFGVVATGQLETGGIRVDNFSGSALHLTPSLTGDTNEFEYTGATVIVVGDGLSVQVPVNFRPDTPGDYSATLDLGGDVDSAVLIGSSAEVLHALRYDPPQIEIFDAVPMQPVTGTVTITNIGGLPVDLEPYTIDPLVRSISPAYHRLHSGASVDMTYTYEPIAYGRSDFRIVLAPAHGLIIDGTVWPRFDFEPDENRLALFFDTITQLSDLTITPEPQSVFAHLVLINPSDPSGIRGWECRVKSTAGAALVSHDIKGDDINASYPPDFTVGLASPLPAAEQVVLATFEFAVWDMSHDQFGLELVPTRTPSIPGMMSWAPEADLQNLTPLLPVDGDSTVARIYLGTTVALALPTPTSTTDGQAVVLTWHNAAGPDEGYHVWRRVGDGEARRLTSTPLVSDKPELVYRDTAPGRQPGQPTAYSYALVVEGLEVGHSPEVILEGSVLPQATRLLPNVPNPFNPSTTIHFELDRSSRAKVAVYDLAGRLVRVLVDDVLGIGIYAPVWDGRDASGRAVPSGGYYIRLETDTKVDRQKVMLLK